MSFRQRNKRRAWVLGFLNGKIYRSPECIRCGKCVEACPQKCLHFCCKEAKNTRGQSNARWSLSAWLFYLKSIATS